MASQRHSTIIVAGRPTLETTTTASYHRLIGYYLNLALTLAILLQSIKYGSVSGVDPSASSRFEDLHWEQPPQNIDNSMFKDHDINYPQRSTGFGEKAKGESRAIHNATTVNGSVRDAEREADQRAAPDGQTADDWPPWPTLKEADIRTETDRIYFTKYNILPKRSTDCDNVTLPSFDYTVVTALINLRREHWPRFKRQFIKYLYYAAKMLDFHVPMVIYVDEEAVDFVQYHRQGKEHITHIVPVSLRHLEYYKYHDRIREIMESDRFKDGHALLHHPEGFSPDYNVLMNSKLSLLFEASTKNRFRTRYFFWMDVGYGHGEDIYPKSCYWAPWSIMNDVHQITYIQLNPLHLLQSVDDLYKQYLPPFLNGAFFGGPTISIKRYYFLHKEVFERFLDQGKVDDDQTLAVACYFERPLLFNVVKGWWYDAFSLFS